MDSSTDRLAPYYISGFLVLCGSVDYRDYLYWCHITDVIVDQEFEVGHVDQREVAGVELLVWMRLNRSKECK